LSEVTGEVRISRWLGAFDTDRIINPKTAPSQFRGGIVMAPARPSPKTPCSMSAMAESSIHPWPSTTFLCMRMFPKSTSSGRTNRIR
jgi:hypothetical protein